MCPTLIDVPKVYLSLLAVHRHAPIFSSSGSCGPEIVSFMPPMLQSSRQTLEHLRVLGYFQRPLGSIGTQCSYKKCYVCCSVSLDVLYHPGASFRHLLCVEGPGMLGATWHWNIEQDCSPKGQTCDVPCIGNQYCTNAKLSD